jgi:hypothetical protein
MYNLKRIFFIMLLISPFLLAFFLGYPIKNNKERSINNVSYSQRCFKTGELKQYIDCFKKNDKLRGIELLGDINKKINSLHIGFNYLFFIGFFMIIVLFMFI